jgi:hypothetical protein
MLGGVVHDDEQGQHGVRHEGQPGVTTAVEVEQFTEARPGLAASAVTAPRAALEHQAGPLQGRLHQRVGERGAHARGRRSDRSGAR